MPIWEYGAEDLDQEVVLTSWSIKKTDAGDRHFVGLTLPRREGRVSSKVVAFDPETGVGTTRSGRRYRLHGRPGGNVDSDYVWNNWKAANRVTTARDVTREYA